MGGRGLTIKVSFCKVNNCYKVTVINCYKDWVLWRAGDASRLFKKHCKIDKFLHSVEVRGEEEGGVQMKCVQ